MSDAPKQVHVALTIAKPDRAGLFGLASEQGGYFTAEQARVLGFSWALLSHHAKSGHFSRVRRGLYRLREYPSSPREDILSAWLAVGKDAAVVSHESALDILGLSDVIPDAIHLTVPRSRRHLPQLSNVKVHTSSKPFRKEDLVVRDGVTVTSAARSILDAAEAGTAPEQIELAVAQALERGLTTPQQLRHQAGERGRRLATLITRAIQKVER
ncbi:MAG: type IV toxin-antitoxin system AbiEi family antitoxin domain-containing protein [Chloroflexi bacterium]|nr:type IV toxin-antitoxin system AbiEi family antitoxin domain-containing protein [Chloroflexota bacterium]